MQPQEIYLQLLDHLHDGVYFVDSDRRIIHWNAAAERISGYSADEVVGSRCQDNILRHVDIEGNELCFGGCPLHRTLEDKKGCEVELVYLHHRLGHRVPIHVHTLPVFDPTGAVQGAFEIFAERNSAREDLQRRISDLRQKLSLDSLTQISNRANAEHNLATRLFDFREGGTAFGVLFMDIDHFKEINDRYGHNGGDRALTAAAATLRSNVRPDDLVARWGGEEFIIGLGGVDAEGMAFVADKLTMLVRASKVELSGESVQFTISTGATLAQKSDDVASLINRADSLMYDSKHSGRDRVTVG